MKASDEERKQQELIYQRNTRLLSPEQRSHYEDIRFSGLDKYYVRELDVLVALLLAQRDGHR